ncbi:uncharacterized protein LOC144614773 [Panthera onca]
MEWGCRHKSRHRASADVCYTQSMCWAMGGMRLSLMCICPGPFADPEVAPVSENNTDSKRAKKDTAIMDARGPGPFPGWPCRPYHMDHPSSPAKGWGPPPPPPPAPPPTPFGQLEV